jgi:8-oxo-dGTP pyrophosphatase MutT (NUDIX family)
LADLEAALEARHPDRFRKHNLMLAVAGVAAVDGKLLLLRDTHGFWAGVGGWVEPGESPEGALLREAQEELGVEARVTRVFRPFIAWNVPGSSDGSIFLLFNYGIELASGDFRLQPEEVTDSRWFGPEEWPDVPMLPWVRALFDDRIAEWAGGGI